MGRNWRTGGLETLEIRTQVLAVNATPILEIRRLRGREGRQLLKVTPPVSGKEKEERHRRAAST